MQHTCSLSSGWPDEGRKFFVNILFSLCIEMMWEMLERKENVKKKCTDSALISSPGRWTGNKINFKGGLKETNSQ